MRSSDFALNLKISEIIRSVVTEVSSATGLKPLPREEKLAMPDSEMLTEGDWQTMARSIKSGACVLVLGPAIAVDPADVQHTPLTTVLARHLADRLKTLPAESGSIINPDDLAHICERFCAAADEPGFGRGDLETEVEQFYAEFDGATTTLHYELAGLPFTLVVNTTPDKFMANAFKQRGKDPQADYYDYRHKRDSKSGRPEGTIQRPTIYDLYGSRTDSGSLILSESDLLAFLVAVIRKAPALPSFATRIVSDESTTFLFVGFGFLRWHVKILFYALQLQGHRYKSLALEPPDFFRHRDRPQTAMFFQRDVGFKEFSWEQLLAGLQQHREALVGAKNAQAPTADDTGPLVFLSYFHDDEDAVAGIEEHLKRSGIQPWRDRRRLQGGDEWNPQIRAVLDETVDYVVVFQSSHMEDRAESYVHKEVAHALERQEGFQAGFRFLIPVKLDRCSGFPELKGLQCIDLTDPNGAGALVNAIKQDWAKRPRKPRSKNQ